MNRVFDHEFGIRSARLNPFAPKVLRKNYGGGDIGLVGAAAIYAASAVASWASALLVPGVQAAANITLMNRQRDIYDNISTRQVQYVTNAVNNYMNGIDSLLPLYAEAFPDVPQAAEYVPIDSCCIQGATIECNISHIERAGVYSSGVNRYKEQEAITRSIVFDPRFLAVMDMQSIQLADLVRGVLPIGSVVDVLSDRSEQDALIGNIGNSRKTTARDLGIAKVAVQAAGRDEWRKHHTFIGTAIHSKIEVSNIEDLMQTPAQRIALALQQAQLIQNSLQNLFNTNARKPPYLMAQLETKIQRVIARLQYEASKASLQNTFVPNYAAVLNPMVKSVAGAIGDTIEPAMKNMMFGPPGGQAGFTTNQATQNANQGSGDYATNAVLRPSGAPGGF